MEHLEHFTRNNVEEEKIITISLNDSFCRVDPRHVSLVHTQVAVPALLSSKGKEGHFTTQPVHTSASIDILVSPWYQRAAHCPGVCQLSLWWLLGPGVEWDICPLGILMPTSQVLTRHLPPAWFSPSVLVLFTSGTQTWGCTGWLVLLNWVPHGEIPALQKAQGASRTSFSPSSLVSPQFSPNTCL